MLLCSPLILWLPQLLLLIDRCGYATVPQVFRSVASSCFIASFLSCLTFLSISIRYYSNYMKSWYQELQWHIFWQCCKQWHVGSLRSVIKNCVSPSTVFVRCIHSLNSVTHCITKSGQGGCTFVSVRLEYVYVPVCIHAPMKHACSTSKPGWLRFCEGFEKQPLKKKKCCNRDLEIVQESWRRILGKNFENYETAVCSVMWDQLL